MADQEDRDAGLEISDEDAEQLLADPQGGDDDGEPDSDQGDPDQLGDPGRRALDRLREERKAARVERDKAKNELAEMRKRLAKYEDEGKSELQRLQEAAESGKTRAEKAESALRRREIAEDRAPAHASLAQIKAVAKRLNGDDDDALAEDADELFSLLAPVPAKESTPKTSQRPKERLRPGNADPEEDDEEVDPRKLADAIRRNR